MAFLGATVSIGTTPTIIAPTEANTLPRGLNDPIWVMLQTGGTTAVTIGGPNVAAGVGITIPVSTILPFRIPIVGTDVLYGIASLATTISVLVSRQ